MYRRLLLADQMKGVNEEIKGLDDGFIKICKSVVSGRSEKNTGSFFSVFSFYFSSHLLFQRMSFP